MFITLEGIEGSGKTTQTELLYQTLTAKGYKTLKTREPGGPPITEKIRAILLDPANGSMVNETELLLYLACRAQHTAEWIIPALKRKEIVICDRYTDSTLAYQGGGRQLDEHKLLELTNLASYELKPDMTFLIDIPVTKAMNRITDKSLDRLEQEGPEFHERVREKFLSVAKTEPNRYTIINGLLPVRKIHEQIVSIVLKNMKEG